MICSPVFIKYTSLMRVIYSSDSSHLLPKKTCFRRTQIEFASDCFVYYLFVLFGSVCPIPSHHTRYFFLSLLWQRFLLNIFLLECSLYISIGRKKNSFKELLLSSTELFSLYSFLHWFALPHCRRVSLS